MKTKVQTWREIADDAREIGRRLAVYAFNGGKCGCRFQTAMNYARGVLRRASGRRHVFSQSAEMGLNCHAFYLLNQIGA